MKIALPGRIKACKSKAQSDYIKKLDCVYFFWDLQKSKKGTITSLSRVPLAWASVLK